MCAMCFKKTCVFKALLVSCLSRSYGHKIRDDTCLSLLCFPRQDRTESHVEVAVSTVPATCDMRRSTCDLFHFHKPSAQHLIARLQANDIDPLGQVTDIKAVGESASGGVQP